MLDRINGDEAGRVAEENDEFDELDKYFGQVNALDIFLPHSTSSTDPVAEYVALEKEKRALEARVKAIDTKMDALATQIIERWVDCSQTSAKIGGMTVYIATDIYCSKQAGVAGADLADTLIELGLGAAVSYNANSLKSWVKEQLAAARESNPDVMTEDLILTAIPENLRNLVRFTEEQRLRTRKS